MHYTFISFIGGISFLKLFNKSRIGGREKAANAQAPYTLREAKQFVPCFVKGQYSPEKYEAFLLWLKGATIDELNAIAEEHEALHESWSLSAIALSPEWIAGLEQKLDKAD